MAVNNRNRSMVLISVEWDVSGIWVVRFKFVLCESVVSFKTHVWMRVRLMLIQEASICMVSGSWSMAMEAWKVIHPWATSIWGLIHVLKNLGLICKPSPAIGTEQYFVWSTKSASPWAWLENTKDIVTWLSQISNNGPPCSQTQSQTSQPRCI